jgi:hypothetical protein
VVAEGVALLQQENLNRCNSVAVVAGVADLRESDAPAAPTAAAAPTQAMSLPQSR